MMIPLPRQTCNSCRYYRPELELAPIADEGRCHRHPPQIGPRGGEWPEVDASDWCGEWQPQQRPTPPKPEFPQPRIIHEDLLS